MEMLKLLEQLVSIPSPSGKEKKIGEYLAEVLDNLGFEVIKQEVEKDRFNIIAKRGQPKVIFFGHMDTVPPAEGWKRDPFKLSVEGTRAYGLGSWDMKGGIAAIIAAIESENDVGVIFTVDEENISKGAWKVVEEKDALAEIWEKAKLIVSAEAGNFESGEAGLPCCALGRYGRVRIEVKKTFPPSHLATGKSLWLKWLCRLREGKNVKWKIAQISLASKGFSEPEAIKLVVDVLIHPKARDWEKEIGEIFGEFSLVKRETPYLMPYLTPKEKLAEVLQLIPNAKTGIGISPGDESALAQLGLPILICGPRGANEHAPDEWVDITSLDELKEVYARIIKQIT